jgi:hypothetical protein
MNTAQILSEMAIDVWRLRTAGRREDLIEQPPSESVEAGGDAETAPAVKSTAPAVESGTRSPGLTESEAQPVAGFNVVSLSDENGLLLFQSRDLKSRRRFAADLLAAATGHWSRDFRQLIFVWPQSGIKNTNASMVKALTAFVEKQINDADSNNVLVTTELFRSLDQSWPAVDIQQIPEIDELMVNAELKKSVWLEMSKRRLL